ncbi:unnamed protein product [Amoebophrya sp. A25]|nr:unnamed protein product [Amoebophrya sp. A25]|eukprot:GSA25T00021586001.1
MATIAEEHHSTNLAPAATGESGLVTPKTKIVGDGEAGAQGGFPEEDFTEGERNFLMKKQEMLRRSPSKSIFSLLNASPAISLASDVSPSKSFCLGTPSPTKAKTQDRPHPPTPSPSKRSRMSADHSPSAGNTPRKRSPTGDGTESPQQIMDRLQKRWREYLASIAAGEEQAARWQRWKTKMAEIEANQLDAEERGKFFNEIRYRQLDANFNGQFLFQQVTEMIFEDKQHPLDPSGRYRLQSLLEKTIQATNGESVAAMAALAELEETEGQFARARELYSIIVDKAREGNEVALTCLVDVAEFRERQMARDAEERRKRKSRNKFKVGKNKALIDKGIKKDSKAADFMLKVVRERENIERPLLRQSLKEGFLDPMRDALERIIRNHPQDKRHLSGYKRQVHRERQREREIHEECLASLKMMAAEKQKVAKPVTSPIASSRNAAPAGLVEGKPGTLGFSARRASATAAPAAAAAPAAGGGLGGLFGKKSRGSSQSVAASSPASTAAPGSPQAETPGGAAALLGGGGAKGAGLKGMGGGGLLAGLAGAGGASGSATATITPVSVATPAAKPGNLSGAAAAQRPQTTPSGAAPKAACGPPQKSGSKEDVGKKSAGSKAPQKSGSKALHKGASTPGSKSGERTSAQMFDNLENRLMKQQKDAEREVEAEEARKRPAELTEENVVEWVPKKYQKEIAPEYKSQVERGYASDFDREVTCNHAGVLTFHTRMARAKFGQQVRRTQKKTRGGKLLKKAFLQREFESANLTGSPQQKIEENEEEENSHEDGRLHINTPPRKHRPGTAPFLRNIDVWDESKNFDLLGMLHQKSEKYYDAALSCRMLVQRRAQKQKQEEEARKQKEQKAREAVGLEAAEAEKARLEKEKRPGPPFTVRCDTDVRPNTAGIGKGIAGGRKGSKRSPRRDLRLLRPMMSSTRLNGGSKTRSSGAPAAQSQGGAGSGTGAHSASGGGGSPTRGKNVMKKKVPTPPKDPDEVNAYPDLDVVTEFNIHSGVQRFDPRRTRRTYGLVPMPTPAPPDDRYTLRALPPDVPPKIL